MLIAHKIEIGPNKVQATHLSKACGIARFAYNWALHQWKEAYAAGEKPTEAKLRKQLNAIKRNDFPWMLEVTKSSPQQAIKDLGTAFKRFFKGEGRYPQFKKKGVHDTFRADNGDGRVSGKRVWIPKLGWIRLREKLRFTGKIISIVVSRVADKWFASITVDTDFKPTASENQASVGIDLGIQHMATLSTGETIDNPLLSLPAPFEPTFYPLRR
ncbi:RNA-guided endonuclease InsQ/TnpB family protein [Magnetococcales bacterium HHB-1]